MGKSFDSEKVSLFTILAFAIFSAVVWYRGYVVPNRELMYAVMECTGSDASQEAYDVCLARIQQAR